MSVSEYELFGVENITPKLESKSHVAYRAGNAPDNLAPCFACGSDPVQGWSMLGSFVMCSDSTCRNQLHMKTGRRSQDKLARRWNQLNEPLK